MTEPVEADTTNLSDAKLEPMLKLFLAVTVPWVAIEPSLDKLILGLLLVPPIPTDPLD